VNLSDDHDNDGVSNGVEHFLGGTPGNTTGFTPLPALTTVTGVRNITWVKSPGYTGAYAADFVVETPAGPAAAFASLKITGP
jgi:hypothetical protein